MGYVSGQPLSAYIASKKRQPEREAAKVVRKIALALQEAHAQGILHRDLKPNNIMIDKRGEPIVMDFGVACWFEDQTKTRLTQQGAIVGTPAYMAPEQIEGQTKVGPAADIYSLGVLFFQILTGRCPFEGTVLAVISQVLHKAPPIRRNSVPISRRSWPPSASGPCRKILKSGSRPCWISPNADRIFERRHANEKLRQEPSIAETIEFSKPKRERPQPLRTPVSRPARPRPTRKQAPRGKTRTNWAPAAILGGGVVGLLAVGALIGRCSSTAVPVPCSHQAQETSRAPGHPAASRTPPPIAKASAA